MFIGTTDESSQSSSSPAVEEEEHLIIKAIWDYNELFRRRFGDGIVTHVYSDVETCAVPATIINNEGDEFNCSTQLQQPNQHQQQDIAKLFFFAYSALLNKSNDDTIDNSSEQGEEEPLNLLFGNKAGSLIEKIAHHYIVCLFLPHQRHLPPPSQTSTTYLERLKIKFPTLHQSKESGMIWKTSSSPTELYESQLKIMKSKHKWKMGSFGGKDLRIFSTLDWNLLEEVTSDKPKRVILKTATDNFEDFCQYFAITCEFASGYSTCCQESTLWPLRKHLLDIYTTQIQSERNGSTTTTKPLSDYIIVLEDNEIASAGMILYGNELESEQYKEHSNCAAIYSIATREQFRGRGYATMVVISLMELARERGYERVILHASESGCNLYAKLGFETRVSIDVCTIALFLDDDNNDC